MNENIKLETMKFWTAIISAVAASLPFVFKLVEHR
jgi:hypothetical protein